ncbi:Peptidyl-prolyl cis-trans isomerase cyp15 [Thecaphora frezii]
MTETPDASRKRSRSPSSSSSPGPMPPPPADDAGSDSDASIGPMPASSSSATQHRAKKPKTLAYTSTYLAHLPNAERYYKSLMHRDTINHVTLTPHTDFLITSSVDGHIKFWKKSKDAGMGVDFVKHYRAHLALVCAVAASADGRMYASAATDGSVKVFDVLNFDLINMIKLNYTPRAICWVHRKGRAETILAIAQESSNKIHLYDGSGDGTPLATIDSIHRQPCHLLSYNEKYDCVVSADVGGMVEYWTPSEPYHLPKGVFEFKSSTDLFDFKKTKTMPSTLSFSPDFSAFATFSPSDRQIRLFDFATGKLRRKYDESLRAVQEMQQAGTATYQLDDMEFGRRLAVERDLDAGAKGGVESAADNATGLATCNVIFDESGHFLSYGTMFGIKVVNTVTNKVARLLGKDETTRFLNISLYQGAPSKKAVTNIALAASDNPLVSTQSLVDPTLFTTAHKRSRFYLFTRLEPSEGSERDVFNERPTREEQTIATTSFSGAGGGGGGKSSISRSATLHTTMGDIHIRLFPEHCPRTVENFVGLAKKGYYDGVIFHRVIRKFMIQTGDPLGDGTGGESLWGKEFEDEIRVKEGLRHAPYTLSMANAGKDTNGSQFFITTVEASWLDGKHTVFGRAQGGLDVVHRIEGVKVDKNDKPRDEIKILNISLH